MGRPCKRRRIGFNPKIKYFKPAGLRVASLEVIELKKEELEALRLKNLKNLDQKECAQKMNTSPATLQRILASANEKVARSLVEGKALKILDS